MEYRNILRHKIEFIITNDLTIGRSDNDVIPYTSEQINNFIKENNDKIEKVITVMIDEYTIDGDLELLKEPLFDWITEYLEQYIDTTWDMT